MPRLTSHDYLIDLRLLCVEWEKCDGAAFAELLLQHQLDLHDYFAPSVPFIDKEALTHRSAMTKAFPSLPQKAGRAYQAIHAAIDGIPNQIVDTYRDETMTVEMIAGKRRSLRITGIARPKVDHYRLARALMTLANDTKESTKLDRMVEQRRKH